MNLPEPFYILALVGAASAVLLSLEGRRWLLWTVVAGVLVGVAFNEKMLAAWIPGPALALAIVAGTRGVWWSAWREWLPRLGVLAVATFVTSASWMIVVDAWPADARPYIGGSTDNSVSNLILVYNGLDRVEGFEAGATITRGRGFTGPLRMFDEANGGQIAWLLPLAVIGGIACLWRWRGERLMRALVVLWLGWLLLFATVFSFAEGIYHPYYTAALAPGSAALVGLSAVAILDLARAHLAWLVATSATIAATLGVQILVSGWQDDFFEPLRYLSIAVVVAGIGLLLASRWRRTLPPAFGLGVSLAGLLLLPGAWSAYEMTHAASSPISPRAGPRAPAVAPSPADSVEDDRAALAAWLESHQPADTVWAMVAGSSHEAGPFIVDHGLSVAPMGGFSGRDAAVSEAEFRAMVEEGKVRYVLLTRPDEGTSRTVTNPSTVPRPRTSSGFTQGNVPVSGSSRPPGTKVMFDYAEANCVPVSDPAVPLSFRSPLDTREGGSAVYDCLPR
jgi:4-amino-4-deoxy-L-arabinose transferase-like glycosyltransferase